MNKLASALRILVASVAFTVGTTGFVVAQCVYADASFPNSNGCQDTSCGLFCSSTSSTSKSVCMNASQGCCWCTWDALTCDCTGHYGVENAVRHSWSNGSCNSEGNTCYTLDYNPLPISPDPGGPGRL